MTAPRTCPDCGDDLVPIDEDAESGFYECRSCGWEGILDD